MYSKRKISKSNPITTADCFWKRYTICVDENAKIDELTQAAEKIIGREDFFGAFTPLYKVGFTIIHAGLDMDFVVFGFWVNGNELVLKVFKSLPGESHRLKQVDLNNSSIACVWDLYVIQHEQKSWIDYVLKPEKPDVDSYCNDQVECYI